MNINTAPKKGNILNILYEAAVNPNPLIIIDLYSILSFAVPGTRYSTKIRLDDTPQSS
jgi:hypothetical protein